MKLTTTFPITPHPQPIDYDSSVVLLGSCFSDNIGDKLSYYGFEHTVNPFGVIFNPHSLRVLIEKSVKKSFTENDVDGHFSFLAHSDVNGARGLETLANLQIAGENLKHQLEKASHVIITLGTAWVYEIKAAETIVANCHQQPQALFNKRLLSIEEIASALEKIKISIGSVNPAAQTILTLSPVRHTRDGMVENTRSKSRLHEAIQQLCETHLSYYFPAYEILMDELRDYRFYAADMIHPSSVAVDFVWARFRESVLSTTITQQMEAVEKFRKLQEHRPKHQAVHEENLDKMALLLHTQYPNLLLK